MQDINAIINDLLTRYHDKLDTRAILIDHSALEAAPALLKAHLPAGKWLIAADAHTWQAAGEAFAAACTRHNLPWERYDVTDRPGHGHPVCDDVTIEALSQHLAQGGFGAAIAVGSGTINDIVKFAATQQGMLAACVGTAPSMNGYTSKIAAVLSHGVKTTQPCQAPVVVIADLDVMADAPARMIASGLGDLISKPVSNADWQLSAQLNGSFHSADAMAVIEQGAAMLDGVAPRLQHQDTQAMAGLLGSLMLSGLAMSIAGSSSPASGGEHLISHFIDMTAHAFDEPYDLHGCQVGVGTLTTAYFYEKLAALDPDTIDPAARAAALASWEDYDAMLATRFGKLHGPVRAHAKLAYPTPEQLEARLARLKQDWPLILEKVQQTLRTREDIERELLEADAPTRFAHLDVTRERARRAIAHSKDIRNRYTILHLAWELGLLEQWTDEALAILHA